jgi:hypothetical protein
MQMWREEHYEDGFIIWGYFDGHPEFHSRYGHTSRVLVVNGNEIETLNSRYTLGTPYKKEERHEELEVQL